MAPKTNTSASAPKKANAKAVKKVDNVDVAPVDVAETTASTEATTKPMEIDAVAEEVVNTNDVDAESATTLIDTSKLHEVVKLIQKVQRTVNKTQKSVNAIFQHLEGADPKTKKRRTKKEPSGFAKPSLLTNELCDFLGIEHGSKLARTEVTKKLTTYIKENNLQNPENRRQIVLDDKLKKLLNVEEGTVVTFFNIQRFLSHYKPDTSVPSETSEEPVAEVVEAAA